MSARDTVLESKVQSRSGQSAMSLPPRRHCNLRGRTLVCLQGACLFQGLEFLAWSACGFSAPSVVKLVSANL